MDNPIPHTTSGSVPVWVWAILGVVILIALSSHSSSTAPSSTLLAPTGPSDSTNALAQTTVEAQTALAMQVLNIAGTEDIARIQARTQEVHDDATVAAIQAQGQANAASQPLPPVSVVVNRGSASTTGNASSLTLRSRAAVASADVRTSKLNLLNNVANAIGDGVHYARGVL